MQWLTNRHTKDVYNDVYPYKIFIGRPKSSEQYTVEELEEMGMVGVYRVGEIINYEDYIKSTLAIKILPRTSPHECERNNNPLSRQ